MQVVITGASGFLGRYVVAEALGQGHHVRAMVRDRDRAQGLSWAGHPALSLHDLDLSRGETPGFGERLAAILQGADAVIHLAASMAGSYADQWANTVVATEHLLHGMTQSGVQRLVGVSSFSVYDYQSLAEGDRLDETTALARLEQPRDLYAQMKLQQEERLRAFGQQGGQVSILRPGLIYGAGSVWHPLLGLWGSDRLWVRVGRQAPLPLVYSENCAEAIVLALGEGAIGATLNLVDDDLPTPEAYTQAVFRSGALAPIPAGHAPPLPAPRPWQIVLPWVLLRDLAGLVWLVAQLAKLISGKSPKLPGILIPARLAARFKPLHFSNARAKQCLGWRSRYSLAEALDRSRARGMNAGPASMPPEHPVPGQPEPLSSASA